MCFSNNTKAETKNSPKIFSIMNQYDIFISYRRTAYETANLIATRLKASGYRVFFDLESMRSGPFNSQLYDVIDNCKDFILVLSPNALDRCTNEGDWVKNEIIYAMKQGKNIVPILLRGFEWTECMPEGLEKLPIYQGVAASPDFFDLAMQRLNSYLKSHKYTQRRTFVKWFAAIALSLVILLLSLFFVFRVVAKPACKELVDELTKQVCLIDLLVEDNKMLQEAWYDYSRKNPEVVENALLCTKNNLGEYRAAMDRKLVLSSWQGFLVSLYGVDKTALDVITSLADGMFSGMERDIELLEQHLAVGEDLLPSQYDVVQITLSLYALSADSYCYSYLQILNNFPDSIRESYHTLRPHWMNFPSTGLGLNDEEYDMLVQNTFDKQQEKVALIKRIKLIEADSSYKQELEPTQNPKPNMKLEKEHGEEEIEELSQEIRGAYERLKKECTLQDSDPWWKSWNKISRLASCLTVLGSDVADRTITPAVIYGDLLKRMDEFAMLYPENAECISTARLFYKEVSEGKRSNGGLLIWGFKDDADHPFLEIGDIIIGYDGAPICSKADLKNGYTKNNQGCLSFLRLKNRKIEWRTETISDLDIVGFLELTM